MYINSVCIVGGGSSGWMTAAALCHKFPEINVTLVESPNIPTIGVGESTLGHINRYFTLLGLKDEEWMPACNATYKTSIKFTNFRKDGDFFHYPFGFKNEARFPPIAIHDMRHNNNFKYKDELNHHSYAEIMHDSTLMTNAGKMTYNLDGKLDGFNFHSDTAYHMSADLFGEFLKNKFCGSIRHIIANVEEVVYDDDKKNIKYLRTNKDTLTADLYIDCTGFKSLLIGEMTDFFSFKPMLGNDRAVTCHVEYDDRDKQMHSVTNCQGMDYGWTFEIPLWDKIGYGYVFDSDYIDWEDAEKELRDYLGKDVKNFNRINIRHGRQEEPWIGNCLAVGLSYGFIEPLESTGLMTTHENILYLIDTIKRRNKVTRIDVDSYNYTVDHAIEAMKNFIAMHYVLSGRDDNKYWQDCTNVNFAGKNDLHQIQEDPLTWHSMLQSRLEYYQLFDGLRKNFWSEDKFPGLIYIAAGQDFSPINEFNVREAHHLYPVRKSTINDYHKQWQEDRKAIYSAVEKLPTHYEYLRDYIYVEKD